MEVVELLCALESALMSMCHRQTDRQTHTHTYTHCTGLVSSLSKDVDSSAVANVWSMKPEHVVCF